MRKAFTLIELLVVIAIIGILAALVLVSITNARAKTRDTQRKSDINQIAKALEMYYGDNEDYPAVYRQPYSEGSSYNLAYVSNKNDTSTPSIGWNDLIISTIETAYIKKIPTDPTNDSAHYYVYYSNFNSALPYSGKEFSISAATLENLNDQHRCEADPYHLYTYYNTLRYCNTPFLGKAVTNYSFGISNQQKSP